MTFRAEKSGFDANLLFSAAASMVYWKQQKGGIVLFDLILAHPVALAALILGYALLVVEMCIPGFGLPGILGAILAVLGVVTLRPSPLQMLIVVVVYVALLGVALAICLRSAAKGRLSKSRLVLNEVATQAERPEDNDLNYFIGKTGAAHTPLRPAGIAEFDGVRLSVVSEGDFIEAGAPVRVERVQGKRIVVARIRA